jgi:hypothetical protein
VLWTTQEARDRKIRVISALSLLRLFNEITTTNEQFELSTSDRERIQKQNIEKLKGLLLFHSRFAKQISFHKMFIHEKQKNFQLDKNCDRFIEEIKHENRNYRCENWEKDQKRKYIQSF